MPQNMSSPVMSLLYDFHCLTYFTFANTSSFEILSTQLIFSILHHFHILKASNSWICIFISVHISAAYSATLHTKHIYLTINTG